MALRVITPPVGGLISLDEAKAQLRVDWADEDSHIKALIMAASQRVETMTQRRFLSQDLEWVRDDWRDPMVLPIAGATDCQGLRIDQVSYVDLTGETLVLDPSQYWVRPAGVTLSVVKRWYVIWPWLGDGAERIVIKVHVEGAAAGVPDEARHAVKLLVAHWYQHREAVVGVENRDSSAPLPLGVSDLLTGLMWS